MDAIEAPGLDVVFSCLSEYPEAQVFPVAQTVKSLPAMRRPGFSWRRKWQLTPGFLSGKFHGQRILVGYIVYGVTKSQTRRSD